MSFRNTFITDYIYQASDGALEANNALREVFKKYSRHLDQELDERGYGYFAGTFSALDGSIYDMGLPEIVNELEQATRIPFRLTILVESGPHITYQIEPRLKQLSK